MKKRKYNTRRISLKISYSVQEIAELFGIHKNAALNWIKAGLKIIDQKKPYLINGSDLIEFLNIRQKKRKHKCKLDEFYCFKCRLPRKPLSGSIQITPRNIHRLKITAKCSVCLTNIFKDGSAKKQDEIELTYGFAMQPQEHIVGCNDTSINSDILENDKYEQIQFQK